MPSQDQDYAIRARHVRRSFNEAAARYDEFALLQQTVTERLLETFDYLKIHPATVLDMGAGTGYGTRMLTKRFNKARFYQCDLADEMLKKGREQKGFFSKQHFLCADASQIPLQDSCMDVVFSSLMLQWCSDLDAVFAEIRRVLRTDGVFVFASFGPDTLQELRDSWRKVDPFIHTNAFVDMHDVGDALIRNGLGAPVLSVEQIVLTYNDCWQLMRELKGLGAKNMNPGRRQTLAGKGGLAEMMQHYETLRQNDKLPASYEVIYGHAWHLGNSGEQAKEQTFTVDTLRQQLKKRT